RFFGVSVIVALLIGLTPVLRRRKIATGVLLAGLLAGLVVALTYSNGERLPAMGHEEVRSKSLTFEHAFDVERWPGSLRHMVTVDPRPRIWHAYADLGEEHPWLGVGFGKPLPAYAYADALPPDLITQEPHAKTHAHDLFLNTWLQVGVIGLMLECLLFVALIRAFLRTAPADVWLRAAGIALVCGVISKNLTDDFLWQSTSLAFWGQAGWLLGRARLSGMIRYRLASGRSVAMRRLRRVGN
ncbi:MAG: O-antigen ligase family protein, partial [Janthinobacterium lividum]